MSKEESNQIVKEFEEKVMTNIREAQKEVEDRQIKQRLKWIVPWHQSMKSTEMLQYNQLHSVPSSL